MLDQKAFNRGLSKFLNAVPNIAADIPMLPEWLSSVMMTLYDNRAIYFKEITWYERRKAGADADEEPPMVEDYYRVMAQFLKLMT